MLSYIRRLQGQRLRAWEPSTYRMFPLVATSLVVWIGVAWFAAMCLSLVLVIPLCIAAKHAGVAEELDAALDRLEELRAPSGQRFFATPIAREELCDELQELVR